MFFGTLLFEIVYSKRSEKEEIYWVRFYTCLALEKQIEIRKM